MPGWPEGGPPARSRQVRCHSCASPPGCRLAQDTRSLQRLCYCEATGASFSVSVALRGSCVATAWRHVEVEVCLFVKEKSYYAYHRHQYSFVNPYALTHSSSPGLYIIAEGGNLQKWEGGT